MVSWNIPPSQVARLEDAILGTSKKLRRELNIAVNKTAKITRNAASKGIREELAAPAKAVNRTISLATVATETSLVSGISINKTKRIPLRDFRARQGRRGTSYKISKSKGRKTIADAFQGPRPGVMKWGGRVYTRAGKAKTPIIQQYGPSPWGVAIKKKLKGPLAKDAKRELRNQVERRIKYNVLKSSGAI